MIPIVGIALPNLETFCVCDVHFRSL